ncbi:MAG: hypothetical protein IKO75_09695 [Bacteroidales bacterium]|nr:hypothetical protein [Bacteroidales bacterium]
MKKVFLAVLCAGLFFACGNKKQAEPEALVDSVPVEEVVEEVAEVVEEPVAEEPVAQAAPAKKTNTTAKKQTPAPQANVQKVDNNTSVKDRAEKAATNVANTAIDKAEKETTNAIVNSGKKKR